MDKKKHYFFFCLSLLYKYNIWSIWIRLVMNLQWKMPVLQKVILPPVVLQQCSSFLSQIIDVFTGPKKKKRKHNITSNLFNIYEPFVGVGDVFSKHSSESLSSSYLYSWVWSGSRFHLWCSAGHCGRAAPSGDRGYSGTSPCGCRWTHWPGRCHWLSARDLRSWSLKGGWTLTRQAHCGWKKFIR